MNFGDNTIVPGGECYASVGPVKFFIFHQVNPDTDVAWKQLRNEHNTDDGLTITLNTAQYIDVHQSAYCNGHQQEKWPLGHIIWHVPH